MPENLEAIMTRFKNNTQTLEHINNLSLLIKEGKITLATGERSVALGGNDKQRSFLHQVAQSRRNVECKAKSPNISFSASP